MDKLSILQNLVNDYNDIANKLVGLNPNYRVLKSQEQGNYFVKSISGDGRVVMGSFASAITFDDVVPTYNANLSYDICTISDIRINILNSSLRLVKDYLVENFSNTDKFNGINNVLDLVLNYDGSQMYILAKTLFSGGHIFYNIDERKETLINPTSFIQGTNITDINNILTKNNIQDYVVVSDIYSLHILLYKSINILVRYFVIEENKKENTETAKVSKFEVVPIDSDKRLFGLRFGKYKDKTFIRLDVGKKAFRYSW